VAGSRLTTTLLDKYRIDRMLGAGGYGQVYLATHLQLRTQVAIKFLLSQWASRPIFRERFRREARALALLSHPHIVGLHDFGEDAGELFLVMEYVLGEPLSALAHVVGLPMAPARTAALIDQLLAVLEVVHERGIVHRDLKPANVMVCRWPSDGRDHELGYASGADQIKVLDFGMAHFEDPEDSRRLTETGLVFGTLHYMSPEHCRGQNIGPHSDIYATGVILYELLAGATPFDLQSPVDMMTHHMFVTPPPLDQVGTRRAVAPELAALAMWALAKKPEKRPSAAQFRQALRSAMAKTDPVSQARQSSDERIAAAGLPRAERALAAAKHHVATAPNLVVAAADGPAPRVVLWGFDEEGAATLQAALAVNHMEGVRWPPGQPPPAQLDGQPVRGVVLPDRGHTAERVASLRRSDVCRKLPVMVVQVAQSATIPELIRAGASDVALTSTEAGDICRKIWRMVRKGR